MSQYFDGIRTARALCYNPEVLYWEISNKSVPRINMSEDMKRLIEDVRYCSKMYIVPKDPNLNFDTLESSNINFQEYLKAVFNRVHICDELYLFNIRQAGFACLKVCETKPKRYYGKANLKGCELFINGRDACVKQYSDRNAAIQEVREYIRTVQHRVIQGAPLNEWCFELRTVEGYDCIYRAKFDIEGLILNEERYAKIRGKAVIVPVYDVFCVLGVRYYVREDEKDYSYRLL